MKILEVCDSFFPNVDGPNSVMLNIALKLKEYGHEAELLVPKFHKDVQVEGLKIYRCTSISAGKGYRCALPKVGHVKKIIKRGGYDLIHLHSCFPLAKRAQKLGKKYGIPVIITVHTKFRDEFEKRLKTKGLQNFMMNYIMKCIEKCDGIVCVSDGMAETLKDYGLKRRGEVKVIYNATDMPPVENADGAAVEALRKKLGLDGNFVFSFAGRLAEVKNVQFSLAVLAEVKKRGYGNFKFLIIGDGEYGKTLEKTAAKLNLTENVIFAGRITNRKLLAEHYAASDLFLFPSLFDSSGLVVQEAAANGLPAITISGSCSAERIENGVNGFAWEYGAEVWTEEIIKLLNDTAAVKRAGEGAKRSVCLDWGNITKQYIEYYKTLI